MKHNKLISKKHKKSCKILNYTDWTLEHYVLISAIASAVGIPLEIKSSVVGLTICGITGRIKKYQLILRRKRKNMKKVVFLAKIN